MSKIIDGHLTDRAIIELYFNAISSIHIGAGQEGILKQIIRFPVNDVLTPIIPAESIKGSLRSLATVIAKKMDFDEKVKEVINLHMKETHVPENKDKRNVPIEKYKERAKEFLINNKIFTKNQIEELSDRDIVDFYLSLMCPICTLFGSKHFAGRINIYDALPLEIPKVGTYTSTSISRKTQIATEGMLHSVEFVPTGTKYKIIMIIDNVKDGANEAKLLSNLLNYILMKNLVIGGLKSKGYGLLKLNDESSRVKKLNLNENPKTENEKISNIHALLLKEGYYKVLTMKEYIEKLKLCSF